MDKHTKILNGNQQWFTFSITLHNRRWKALLRNVLEPQLNDWIEYADIFSYFLSFDFHEEPQINCSIKCTSDRMEYLIRQLHVKMATFRFDHNKVCRIDNTKSFKFSYNTFVDDFDDFYFGHRLSRFIISYFSRRPINEASIFRISFVLQLIWIKSRLEFCRDRQENVLKKGFGWFWSKFINPSLVEIQLAKFYDLHTSELKDITEGIFAGKFSRSSWYKDLISMSKDCIISNQENYRERSFDLELTFYYIPSLINLQLGISSELRNVQTYIINRIMQPEYIFTRPGVITQERNHEI